MRDQLARGDLPTEGIGILRAGTSLLVGVPGAGLLARVDRPALADRANRQVRVACLLESLAVPAVRSHDARVHDLPVGDGSVLTLWVWEVVSDRMATPAEVGSLAGRLHRASAGSRDLADLAPADPLGATLEQLSMRSTTPSAVEDPDHALLRDVAAELAPVWEAARSAGPEVLVHADLHAGNVIVAEGGPLLADLELAGPGPAAYDLAPQVVAERRYGRPASEAIEFADAYGPDRPDAATVEALVPVYELWVTAWAVSNRGLDAAHEAEARLRLERWRGDWTAADRSGRWTLR